MIHNFEARAGGPHRVRRASALGVFLPWMRIKSLSDARAAVCVDLRMRNGDCCCFTMAASTDLRLVSARPLTIVGIAASTWPSGPPLRLRSGRSEFRAGLSRPCSPGWNPAHDNPGRMCDLMSRGAGADRLAHILGHARLCPWPNISRRYSAASCPAAGPTRATAVRRHRGIARVAARFRPISWWLRRTTQQVRGPRPATYPYLRTN